MLENKSEGAVAAPPKRSWFGSLFDTVRAKILAGLLLGVSTVAVAVLSPLKDIVVHWVWPEKIEVGQVINVEVGQPTLLSILLQDRSGGVGLSGGKVSISSSTDALRLYGPSEFSFEAAPGSIYVAPKDLTVQAREPGAQQLLVKVATNRGKEFQGLVTVKATRRGPSEKDLTGDYLVILNDIEGTMNLGERVEGKRRFSGDASFINNEAYKLDGWRDGTGFSVRFMRGAVPVYKAEGIYCVKKYDELKWFVVNARVMTYANAAHAGAPPLKPAHTIRDKCPGYPADLDGLEGDGLFYASVAAN